MSRDELQQRVWNVPYRPRDRSVDVCVRKLREKLDRRRVAPTCRRTTASAIASIPCHMPHRD